MTDIYTNTPMTQRLDQARSVFGDNPGDIARGIAGNMTNSPTFQDPLQGQKTALGAMDEIAAYDKQLAGQFQQGNQQAMQANTQNNQMLSNFASAGNTAQETIAKGQQAIPQTQYQTYNGILSPFVASGLASGQQQAATDTFNMASQTRSALEKTIGTEAQAYAEALRYSIQQEQIKAEQERMAKEAEERQKQQEFENALSIAQLTGQRSFINPIDGSVYNITDPEAEQKTEKSNLATSEAWNSILSSSQTEYDVWKQIDINQDALRLAGVNVDELWRMHKNLVGKVGSGQIGGMVSDNYTGQLIASGRGELLKDVPAADREKTAKYLVESGANSRIDPVKAETAMEVLSLAQEIKDLDTRGVTGQIRAGTNVLLHPFGGAARNETSLAKIDKLKGLLTIENLGLMKGVLSDTDIKILKSAATTLENMNQSDTAIEAELDRIITVFQARLGMEAPNRDMSPTQPQPGSIRVKLKSTGQTGTIPQGEFDPAIYERI